MAESTQWVVAWLLGGKSGDMVVAATPCSFCLLLLAVRLIKTHYHKHKT